jgi:Mor family transcriptional regulator
MAAKKDKPLKPFALNADTAELRDDLARAAEILDRLVPGKGKELVIRLAAEFGGTYVYFPQEEKLTRKHRDPWIIDKYAAGYRVVEIARAARLSERQVWNILGREPGEEKQMKLF